MCGVVSGEGASEREDFFLLRQIEEDRERLNYTDTQTHTYTYIAAEYRV